MVTAYLSGARANSSSRTRPAAMPLPRTTSLRRAEGDASGDCRLDPWLICHPVFRPRSGGIRTRKPLLRGRHDDRTRRPCVRALRAVPVLQPASAVATRERQSSLTGERLAIDVPTGG